ncbi:Serine hydroxymethyltransferase 4 [Camellia lanceoleosa]|uniref:Serine hydroxymethyltransferase 4 n=1 Tax=Camellia lanceoleosa TaxID=1840588 RepID=A0ACC0GSS1_9ERIC|nr:Serine hydroxymethyltransferase 4 [Camellia lanceoleosa]
MICRRKCTGLGIEQGVWRGCRRGHRLEASAAIEQSIDHLAHSLLLLVMILLRLPLEAADPFEYCDIVTTTTHKSLRGPRAGMIFYRKGPKPAKKGQPEDVVYDLEDKINFAVFLTLQGNKVEKLCDLCNITANKNAVFGDSSALSPGGVRIGTPAMTSRGLVEKDFEQIAEFLHHSVTITLKIQKEHGKLLKDFNKGLVNNKDIEELKADVEKFVGSFDMPGFLMSEMKYKD